MADIAGTPAVGAAATVRYERAGPGRQVSAGLDATREPDANGSEVWQVTGLPPHPAPKAGDALTLMGSTDRRVRTVATVAAVANGAVALTCTVPAAPAGA